ncbi:MAG: glycosyl hydrolase [Planctomycetota bacterium]|nr:MAG: glycosyl hydrolase [Planctomycetota bacterium]
MGLSDARQIGRIRVDPRDPDVVFVAALGHVFGPNEQRGIFRSRDGGKTWKKVLYVDEHTGAVDLAMDMTNPRILYAAFWQVRRTPYSLESGGPGSGLYKSTDGGDTWKPLTKGLPEGIKGRIGVAVSPANPQRVWALVEAEKGGLFRSDDGGKTFRLVNNDREWRQRAWYYTHVFADPQDADTVYVLNVRFGKSTDGGKTFRFIRVPHGDNHDLWIAPEDNRRMINGNDGGANITFNGGVSWSRQDNQPTAQFYHVTTDTQFPYRVYGAQQDNSTVSISSRALLGWREEFYSVGGGESGYIAPDPRDPQIVYAGSYGGYLTRYDHRTRRTRNISVWPVNPMGWGAAELKYRFQWTFPILISPHNPDVLYVAGNVIFRSTNEGQSWEVISPDLTTNDKSKQGPSGGPITKDNTSVEYYCTVFSLAESPLEAGVLWAGSDDGLVHLTRNGGRTWTDVTPLDVPKWALISGIEPSHFDPGTCYLAVNAYKLDDFSPYIFKTDDYGKSWTPINEGIDAQAFVRVVREDPKRKGLLYAGTETGVYISFDDGRHWQSFQQNLPVVPVTDLVVHEDDLVISTQGRSFWILSDLTPVRRLCREAIDAPAFLFPPRKVYKRVDRTLTVFYHLKEKGGEDFSLEFLEEDGDLIKRFPARKEEKDEDGDGGGFSFFFGRRGAKEAPAEAGLNRFQWDMRYPDASRVKGAVMWGGSTRGPQAPPGRYQVRLTVGETVLTEPFEIAIDPRVKTTAEDFRKQFDLLIRIRDRLDDAHDAVNRIRAVRRQIKQAVARAKGHKAEKKIKEAADDILDGLRSIEEELIQTKSKSMQDPLNFPVKLNVRFAALASVVSQSDFAPTDQSYDVFKELSGQLDAYLLALDGLIDGKLRAFNDLMDRERVPAVAVPREDEENHDAS